MTEDREWARKQLIAAACPVESICEKLRTIYDMVHDLPECEWKTTITERLTDAMLLGKKMQNRLVYYKKTYEPEREGNKLNPLLDYEARLELRQKRQDA